MQRYLLVALWLLLGLRCGVTVAAEPEAPAAVAATLDADAEKSEAANEEKDGEDNEKDNEEDNEEPSPDTANTDTAADRTTTGSDDFVPTVQISEDLSVSFPADI